MRYNTGNPVGPYGSSDPRDLYDNAGIIDLLLTGPLAEYLDRLGVPMKSWRGIMQQVTDYLINQGYESIYLAYGAGVVVERQTQLVQRSGELYRVMNASDIPLTLTGTWATDASKLQAVGDAALRQALASTAGSSMVNTPTGTVETRLLAGEAKDLSQDGRLDALELARFNTPGLISNSGSAAARNITLWGDSISHGAFALNTFMHGWARLLNRAINAEAGASSYGYCNWSSLGSGGTATTEVHNVSFSGGSWSGIDAQSAGAALSPNGQAIRSPGVGGTMTIGLPFFQNRAEMHYLRQPGGGTFTITVNGSVVATVNTDGALGHMTASFNLTDAGYGNTVIVVAQTVAGVVDIIGPGYLAAATEPLFNNYSQSGRRLAYSSEAAIIKAMAESSTFILALGHNDQGDGDSNSAYYANFTQRIDWIIQYAKQYNVKLIVPDFCWTAPESSRSRGQLRRAARDTGGIYINLPKMIFSGSVTISTSHLIDTLKMWTDGSHPNKDGHKWVFETVAKAMGLSCSTKKEAIRNHDFWMPLPLVAATGVENSDLANAGLTSAYKRNGDQVLVKLFAENAPTGAFPIGSYALTTAFNAKSELTIAQGQFGGGYVRTADGVLTSAYSLTTGGALTLQVLVAYVNDQQFCFQSPIAPGTL